MASTKRNRQKVLINRKMKKKQTLDFAKGRIKGNMIELIVKGFVWLWRKVFRKKK